MKKALFTIAVIAAVATSATACSHGSSSAGPAISHGAIASVAANPTVKADEQEAARLVQSCVSASSILGIKSCLEGKVSKDKRKAYGACLATAAAGVVGKSGAKVLFEAAAQDCTRKALAA